jgi:GTP-binding protein Era
MPRTGHLALAGAPNVGKSSLLNTLVGSHLSLVSPRAQATRLPVVGIRTEVETQYIFHDLPGLLDPKYLLQERMLAAAFDTLKRMDVILHLHPAPDAPAPALADLLHLTGAPRSFPSRIPSVLVYTKSDLLPQAARKALETDALTVSATTGTGIPNLLERLRPLLPERPFERDTDDVGTQPLRFFVTEFLREAAFEHLDDELPYSFTAQVEEFREHAKPVYIRAILYVERESQKGMVIGQGGTMLKRIGQHARGRLEALLGEQVYLDCWVKVAPNWRKSAAKLDEFGIPRTENGP